jgi:hypothetical protein
MKRLKITIKLKSNPIINNEMYFDGILYFLERKKQLKEDYYNLPRFGKEKLKKIKLPIKRKNGAYLASKACYRLFKNYTNRWRKRWNELSANEWCENKRVYINQKTTKNYDMPVTVSLIKNNLLWWYCIGDYDRIDELMKHLVGIGKEINQGYGLIKSYRIEETTHKGVRVFPVIYERNLRNEIIKTCRCNPPYGSSKIKKCLIRKF